MVRLHKKLGTEEFPLIDQTFYPNHKEMVSLGEVEWEGGKNVMVDVFLMVCFQRGWPACACGGLSCFVIGFVISLLVVPRIYLCGYKCDLNH